MKKSSFVGEWQRKRKDKKKKKRKREGKKNEVKFNIRS